MPRHIAHVFFRADSGFFNGELFDLLEFYHWTYLVKVKLKGLKKLLESQTWIQLENNPEVAYCEFEYKAKGWKKSRKLRAIRTVKCWKMVFCLDETQSRIWRDGYACYCSNLPGTGIDLHEKYKERATSETWIEQVKSQLFAGMTLTDEFDANDMLWQLAVLAYNLSVILRQKVKKVWRQEHATFRNWFIRVPGLVTSSGRRTVMKIYEHYVYKARWQKIEAIIFS